MKVFILGGGPTGLALADGLAGQPDIHFTLIECNADLGGMARTIAWNGYGNHDLGPHKIFSVDKNHFARVKSLLPNHFWLVRPKRSSIYMRGHFLPYPPSPLSLAKVYGFSAFIRMVITYGTARMRSLVRPISPKTFEEDLTSRLGHDLYSVLFKPIALKLWGDPAQLDIKLSQNRVKTPSLMEIIGRMLKIRAQSDFEALEFIYPKGGLQRLWNAIIEKTKAQGEYLLNRQVTGLVCRDGKVNGIIHQNPATGEKGEIRVSEKDFVFSTLPLQILPQLMGDVLSAEAQNLIERFVHLNDLILVFFKIDRPSLLNESWVFVPDPRIPFHRLSEQESFDPEMSGDGSIVCCEIMDNEMRSMSSRTNKDLVALAKQGLKDMGYYFSIRDNRVIRLPSSYPVYKKGFEQASERILMELDRFKNFRTIGRQGAFNYIGTLDAMDIGYGSARWLTTRTNKDDDQSWRQERERTRHYPVLD